MRRYDPWAGVWLTREPLPGAAWRPRTWHRYAYAFASPISYYDAYGEFPVLVPIISGILGGFAAGAGSLIAQMATGEGSLAERWQNVDWGDVAIAAGVGTVAGALAPFVATSVGGAVALGATANVVQYIVTQWSNREPIRWEEVTLSAVIGGVIGRIGGPAPSLDELAYPFARWSPWLDQRTLDAIITNNLLKSVTFPSFARSVSLQVLNNWPISWPEILHYWRQMRRMGCE